MLVDRERLLTLHAYAKFAARLLAPYEDIDATIDMPFEQWQLIMRTLGHTPGGLCERIHRRHMREVYGQD